MEKYQIELLLEMVEEEGKSLRASNAFIKFLKTFSLTYLLLSFLKCKSHLKVFFKYDFEKHSQVYSTRTREKNRQMKTH